MLVYNITIRIDPAIEDEWLNWQKEEHIPEVMASGCFTGFRMHRLLETNEDEPTFVIQYFASSLEDYERYIADTAPLLRKKVLDRWGDKFIAFRTLMEVVH